MRTVIKKDGRTVPYNRGKLINSIMKAFASVGENTDKYTETKAENIADFIEQDNRDEITATELGDLVEKGLMSCKRKDVAKAYILKRYERDKARSRQTELMKTIANKIDASKVENQNANVDEHSFGGRKGEAANALMKDYALNYCMSDMARENHLNNEIYIHEQNCGLC